MKILFRLWAMALFVIAGAATNARAAEAAPKLSPGSTFTIAFPEMPPTLADLLDRNGVKPMMTVFLPGNYSPSRKHPLLIFLGGGNGGSGGNPGVARSLCEGKDFVCVGLPLFKEKVAAPAPGNGLERILLRSPDCKFAWPLYRKMLAKLEEMVPNIDPSRRILGGFSNGAHATAGLIDESDGEIARRFSAFFLWKVAAGFNVMTSSRASRFLWSMAARNLTRGRSRFRTLPRRPAPKRLFTA